MTRICSSLYMLLVLILLTANQGCSQLSNDKGDQENLWSIDVSTANMRKVSSTEKQMLLQLNSDLQSSLQVVSENLGGFEEAFADLIQNGDFKDLPNVKSKDATLPPQCRLRQSKEREGSVALVSKWLADKSATKGTPCTTNYRSEQRTDSISFPGRTLSQMSRRSFVLENPADSDLIRSLSLTESSESFERERKNRNQATRKIGKVDSSATLTTSSGEHFDLKYQLRSEIFNSIVSDNETKDQGRSLSVMTVNGPQTFIILKKDVNYDAEGEPHVKIYLNGELVLDK